MNLNDIPEDGPVTLTTDKGTSIEADMVFKTIGLTVQSDAYRNTFRTFCYFLEFYYILVSGISRWGRGRRPPRLAHFGEN